MRRRRVLSILLAVPLLMAGAGLTACAPDSDPTPTAAPSPALTPSATPTALSPAVAFDGDCASVISTDRLAESMGEAMSFREPQWVDGSSAELGGVTCGFSSDEYLSAFATVWVYPVSVLDDGYVGSEAADSCGFYESTCVISGVFGETWVGLSVYSADAALRIDALRPVLADIGGRAAEQSPPVPGPRDGWWTPTPTCEGLAESLSAASLPAIASDDRPAQGPMFSDGTLQRGCSIDVTVGEDSWSARLVLRAGAGDGVDSVLQADPDARIDYEDRTFATAGDQYPIDGAPGLLLGTDGANLVELLRDHEMDDSLLDERLLDAILTATEG